MKFIKLFNNHSDYNTYISSNDKILPNISYCENENETHLNPWVDPRIIAKFNVTSTSSTTKLSDDASLFTEIEIDGVIQPSIVNTYTFDTTGEHVVKYTLVDLTTIGYQAFQYCTGLTNVTISDSVTSIGDYAFYGCWGLTSITIPDSVTTIRLSAFNGCTGLTSVTIGNGVTTIGRNTFNGCTGLTSVTVQATTPPTLGSSAFTNNASGRKIYVPSASVATYQAASGWSGYASDIQAIS